MRAVRDDLEHASISSQLRATLVFLRTMTLEPERLTPADADTVRAAGVSDAALRDAVHVAFVFNIINRIADALDFAVPPDAALAADAKMLLRMGYKL